MSVERDLLPGAMDAEVPRGPEPSALRRAGSITKAVLPWIVSAGLFWLVASGVSWQSVLASLASVDLRWLAAALAVQALAYFLNSWRWRGLMNRQPMVPLRHAFGSLVLGQWANMLLPVRAGDLLRGWLLNRLDGVSTATAIASVFVDKLFDIVALLLMLAYVATLTQTNPITRTIVEILAVVTIPLVLASFAFAWWRGGWSAIANRFPNSAVAWATHIFERAHLSFSAFRTPSLFVIATLQSVALWSANLGAVVLMFQAFHFDLPWQAAVAVLVMTNLAFLVPAAPAGIGVFQYAAVLALSGWPVAPNAALAFAITANVCIFLLHVCLGTAASFWCGLKPFELFTRPWNRLRRDPAPAE